MNLKEYEDLIYNFIKTGKYKHEMTDVFIGSNDERFFSSPIIDEDMKEKCEILAMDSLIKETITKLYNLMIELEGK